MTYANQITILRIFLIPVMVLVFFLNQENPRYYLTSIFFIAATTDYLDGYLARKLKQVSKLGKFLDPVADKLLVVSSLLLLLVDNNNVIIFIPICIIVLREVLISALREWVARENFKKPLDVNNFGKLKTLFQMFSIGFLLFNGTVFTISTYMIGLYGIYIAAFLSLISMIIYLGNVIKS
ncbi:MAG: CDP-diacylglycerol--glycerol-3-phosphate 3-phosphatidyltransferase [Gammaproteobacteria bacterium]|nr:CDP-diacylglycerol--glycerol-3-phosphate 3-phosphatidyltransferase [Gammaproteobacteria bacterium]MBT6755148.1 CDP-diacylglycerol--glycerol-3-phosphate 3-phosphatidyltransferase [Gammaproteobacteria bacterium]MBT7814411.1 CDP-diacylglycerol--glycerol-3-phosphate 3-phosphatidyltransferase [Gammaproteobacteria bacterium]